MKVNILKKVAALIPRSIKSIIPHSIRQKIIYVLSRERRLRKIDKNIPIGDAYYGSVAREYDNSREHSEFWQLENSAVLKQIDELIGANEIRTVLDLPVGTGRFLREYIKRDLKITGVDISKDMLAIAQKKIKYNENVNLINGTYLDLKNSKFDLIVCIRFIQGIIEYEKALEYLKFFRNITKYLIVELNFGYQNNDNHRSNEPMLYSFNEYKINSLIKDLGYEIYMDSGVLSECEKGFTKILTLKCI